MKQEQLTPEQLAEERASRWKYCLPERLVQILQNDFSEAIKQATEPLEREIERLMKNNAILNEQNKALSTGIANRTHTIICNAILDKEEGKLLVPEGNTAWIDNLQEKNSAYVVAASPEERNELYAKFNPSGFVGVWGGKTLTEYVTQLESEKAALVEALDVIEEECNCEAFSIQTVIKDAKQATTLTQSAQSRDARIREEVIEDTLDRAQTAVLCKACYVDDINAYVIYEDDVKQAITQLKNGGE